MRRIIAAVAFATLVASPAIGEPAGKKTKAQDAWQSQTRSSDQLYPRNGPPDRPHSPNPAWDVYFNDGRYSGSDPDSRIRSMLRRDDTVGD